MAGDNLPLWYHLLYSLLPHGKAKRSKLLLRYLNTTRSCDLRLACLLYISREPAACVLRPRASIDISRRKIEEPQPLDPVLVISRMLKPFYWRRHWCNSVNRNSHTFGCMSRHPITIDDDAAFSKQSDCQCMAAFHCPYTIRWWCVSPLPCRIRGKVLDDRTGKTFS